MRKVTLYTVQSASYALENSPTVFARHVLQWFPDGSVGSPLGNVQREEIPIHHIRDCGRDSFIAVEPKLRAMIEMPIAEKLEGALHDVAMERRSLYALNEKVIAFECASIWRRLWIAFKGRLPLKKDRRLAGLD